MKPVSHPMPFDGETYEPEEDSVRLGDQLQGVYDVMKDGQWRTLVQIQSHLPDASLPSISARLRDLRKEKFGGHLVLRYRIDGGLFAYQLLVD